MQEPYKLTEKELAIFQDQEFMPLKAIVWQKLESILYETMKQLQLIIPEYAEVLHDSLLKSTGKISRGENYKTYAYRVLDYPRVFEGNDFFTFRCVVLWGHPIGFHFILKGKYKKHYQELLLENALKSNDEIWLSDQEDPWVWEFKEEQQILVNSANLLVAQKMLEKKDFLKLTTYLPLKDYHQIMEKSIDIWRKTVN